MTDCSDDPTHNCPPTTPVQVYLRHMWQKFQAETPLTCSPKEKASTKKEKAGERA